MWKKARWRIFIQYTEAQSRFPGSDFNWNEYDTKSVKSNVILKSSGGIFDSFTFRKSESGEVVLVCSPNKSITR